MYYLVYEYYNEYNQFEGSWDWQVEEYNLLSDAISEREILSKNDTRNIKILRDFNK